MKCPRCGTERVLVSRDTRSGDQMGCPNPNCQSNQTTQRPAGDKSATESTRKPQKLHD